MHSVPYKLIPKVIVDRVVQSTYEQMWYAIGSAIFVFIGGVLAAVSLSTFLIPNNIIDGGLVGIAIIASEATVPVLFVPILLLLSLPFIVLAYKNLGTQFLGNMVLALIAFSGTATFITNNDFVATSLDSFEIICTGGLLLGIGVGVVIKFGGCLDGTEVLALILQKNRGIPVGQNLLMFNLCLYIFAGFFFHDLQIAVRSIVTFVIASKVIDIIIGGIESTRAIYIISHKNQLIKEHITNELGIGATQFQAKGAYSNFQTNALVIVIDKNSINDVKKAVLYIDPKAFLFIIPVYSIQNGRVFSPH